MAAMPYSTSIPRLIVHSIAAARCGGASMRMTFTSFDRSASAQLRQWYNLVINSTDVVFSNIDIAGGSIGKDYPKNTGGSHCIDTGSLGQYIGEVNIVKNIYYIIEVVQFNSHDKIMLCKEFLSSLAISGMNVTNFIGARSSQDDPVVGYFVCSNPMLWGNITVGTSI
ncbi:hypothetical protein CC78DRAFT_581292 [Lojkania enalia]|uniref:Uncharacterized protein n=1 Tax=Lojkania enalia TaxID=147567 RepID=A0A9P4MZD8_9PLEO|nr:hypothetical protein CC78DRAFT_581292 [Didymosphaeria enalia]